ncbi:hypothetical protein NXS19_013687 [Fusarium pseudograminearum]|nr:hypothetical protein NXS19_013687 [Fusarium pseudograminearum]
MDVVVGKHDGVVGTIEGKVRGVDASFNSNLGFGSGGGRLDDLLDGSLGLLDDGLRGLVDGSGSGRLLGRLLNNLLGVLLDHLGGRRRVDPDSDDLGLRRLLLNDRSRSRLLLDDLDSVLGDLGSLGAS